MVVYEPFWKTMKVRGLTTYALIHKHGIANGTLYRMRHGKPITTETLSQLCHVLSCKVEDILLYIEETET